MNNILKLPRQLFIIFAIIILGSCGTETFNPKQVPIWDQEMATAVVQAVNDMKAANWTPANPADPGEFGKEIHSRVASLLDDGKGFLGEIWVHGTTTSGQWEIVGIGAPPSGDLKGVINLDIVRVQYNSSGWTIGDLITTDQFFRAYEIKTSATGTVPPSQQAKYIQVVGSQDKCRTAVPPERWSFGTGEFVKNPAYGAGLKTWGRVAGLGVIGAFGIINSFDARDKLEVLTQALADTSKKIKSGELTDVEGCVEIISCQQAAMNFIQTIDLTGNSALPNLALTYIDMAAFSRDYGAACISLGYITP